MYRNYYVYRRVGPGRLEAVFEACATSAKEALEAYSTLFGDTSNVVAVIPQSPYEIALSDW
jgi:hypothetical protein